MWAHETPSISPAKQNLALHTACTAPHGLAMSILRSHLSPLPLPPQTPDHVQSSSSILLSCSLWFACGAYFFHLGSALHCIMYLYSSFRIQLLPCPNISCSPFTLPYPMKPLFSTPIFLISNFLFSYCQVANFIFKANMLSTLHPVHCSSIMSFIIS